MKYAAVLTALMLADAFSTLGLVQLGKAGELNPLMNWLMVYSALGFVAAKGFAGFTLGIALRHRPTAFRLAVFLMVGIVSWHCLVWVL